MADDIEPSDATQAGPRSDDEWIIHALNIHGDFFERSCQQVIRETFPWKLVTTNYPVAVDGNQSELDIRAELEIGDKRLVVLIECKKANPEFVNWVFFPKAEQNSNLIVPAIERTLTRINAFLHTATFGPQCVPVADGGRETRGSYVRYKQKNDKTKTSNAAITDAAKQISLATQSIFREENERESKEASKHGVGPRLTLIVPVIVTTAQLLVGEFNPQEIDIGTGEIPSSKVELSRVSTCLTYEYPLPNYLHPPLVDRSDERFIRRQIVVVPSARFANFLKNDSFELLK